jgi:hypothetical protein
MNPKAIKINNKDQSLFISFIISNPYLKINGNIFTNFLDSVNNEYLDNIEKINEICVNNIPSKILLDYSLNC